MSKRGVGGKVRSGGKSKQPSKPASRNGSKPARIRTVEKKKATPVPKRAIAKAAASAKPTTPIPTQSAKKTPPPRPNATNSKPRPAAAPAKPQAAEPPAPAAPVRQFAPKPVTVTTVPPPPMPEAAKAPPEPASPTTSIPPIPYTPITPSLGPTPSITAPFAPPEITKPQPVVADSAPTESHSVPTPASAAVSPTLPIEPISQDPDKLPPPPPQPPLLFEIAWEVCWQLGGIYTVLKTKADAMRDHWDDRYCLIGPYNPATAAVEFEERPTEGIIREALDRLRASGIPCHYGRWLIPGRPRVILLDYRARYGRLHEDKYLLWADHHIETVAHDGEVNDVTAFGFTVAEFFRELSAVKGDRTVLAHFHEWMGGVAVPRIAHLKLPIATLFTTHATLLGRYLANGNPEFYNHLPFMNPDEEAGRFNIYPRFAIERAAAHASTVFTTVSEVTAVEAERLLGRRPDVILPNGLNIRRFAALHEFQNLHRAYKERIHEFVMGHFFPSYSFDLDNTLYFFTSGRYEYRNKGMDLFIEALHRLNWRMKQMPSMLPKPTVVAFIITRAAIRWDGR